MILFLRGKNVNLTFRDSFLMEKRHKNYKLKSYYFAGIFEGELHFVYSIYEDFLLELAIYMLLPFIY